MTTTLLTAADIHEMIRQVGLDAFMDHLIARMTAAVAAFDPQDTDVRSRDGFHYSRPALGLLEWMPVKHSGDRVTVKVVGYHPENPSAQHLPTILSTVSVYDTRTGHLLGLADGTLLTALRTGAASAIASRLLADPGAETVGLIGCGAQAITQLHAISRCFSIRRILVHDRDPQAAADMAERLSVLALAIEPEVVSLSAILDASDILCTATSIGIGEGPLFTDRSLRPHVHINAAGSDFAGKVELPRALLQRSLVVPDVREQCLREGECQQLLPDEIGPDLAMLMQHPNRFPEAWRQTTVFDSTGWALFDAVAMALMLETAAQQGLGQDLAIEYVPADPKNPYHFLQHAPA